jgi:hypothetical protein
VVIAGIKITAMLMVVLVDIISQVGVTGSTDRLLMP